MHSECFRESESISADQVSTGAFSNLQTELEDISKNMGKAKTWVNKSSPRQRQIAQVALTQAGDKWAQVSGMLTSTSLHANLFDTIDSHASKEFPELRTHS